MEHEESSAIAPSTANSSRGGAIRAAAEETRSPLFEGEAEYFALHRRRLELTLRAIRDWQPCRLADVGSFGLHWAMVLSRIGFRVTGVDLPHLAHNPTTRGEFTRRCRAFSIQFRPWQGIAEALPMEDGEFDAVSCLETLEHLACNHWRITEQWHRALKPGGRLVISVPNVLRMSRFVGIIGGRGFPPNLDEMKAAPFDAALHIREYTRREVRRLLAESGFEVESVRALHTIPLDRQGRHFKQLKRMMRPTASLWPFGGDTIIAVARRSR